MFLSKHRNAKKSEHRSPLTAPGSFPSKRFSRLVGNRGNSFFSPTNKSNLVAFSLLTALVSTSNASFGCRPPVMMCKWSPSFNHHLQKTRFQLILPVDSQNITTNRTGHRMHVEGTQICQINSWNNSFQNMYGMNRQKLTVRPGKSILCQKHLKKRLFLCARTGAT